MKPLLFKVIKQDYVYWRIIFSIHGERCNMNILNRDKALLIFNSLKY